MPKVSVLLPVHNGERFVGASINSIQQQTFTDWEMLVVDDGSTDASGAVIAELAKRDKRITLIRQAQSGIVAALEAARRRAVGSYIARMDADDVAVADRFEAQAEFLDTHPDVVALGGQVMLIDADDTPLKAGRFPITCEECRAYVQFGAPLCHPAVMMRREALARCGGYRRRFEPAEDFDLWLRLLGVGELANLNTTVLQYRLHGGNVSTTRAKANAIGAALALVAMRFEAATFGDDLPGVGLHDWLSVETTLRADQRLFGRAAYLRAITLNGGITDAAETRFLLSSIPALVIDPHVGERPDVTTFTLVRAAYQLIRQGQLLTAVHILGITGRYFPRQFLHACLSAGSRAARSAYTSLLSKQHAQPGGERAVSLKRQDG